MSNAFPGTGARPRSAPTPVLVEGPATLPDLCREYADRLYDYCRSLLPDDDAQSAMAGAIQGAMAQTRRLPDPRSQRAWLYALARAECQARLVGTSRTGQHVGPVPGAAAELADEVLACLEPREREILDLTLRHGLTLEEVARVLDIAADSVTAAALQGRRKAEQWLVAVMEARRPDPRCHLLADLVASWVKSPTRLLRAHISRHVRSCSDCQAAPAKVAISTLLSRMPIPASPISPDRILTAPESALTIAQPADEGWHPDGFPVQPDALENPPPPDQPLAVDEGFTPERPSRPSPADFWEPDLDASDPESRIRWGRLSLVTVAALVVTAATWSLVFQPDTGRSAGGTAVGGGTLVVTPGDRLPPVVDSPPPPPPPMATGTEVSHPTTTPSLTPLAASRPTTRRLPSRSHSAHPTKPSGTPRRSSSPPVGTGPDTPPPPRSSTPPKPSATPTTQPQISTPPPPPPPPPSFSASTSSVDLGTSRQGRVTLASRTGAITWRAGGSNLATTPGSGSIGDGDSVTVDFSLQVGPGTTSDCGRPLSTYLSISWSGDNKGTKGSGTVGVTITYTKTCPQPL
ncbi:sigma-70 family RNA polymerase sigma factor [Sphaerisporangium sp. NPDC005288]|uniref:RNA polymerase sigma factor n=1 Tax=Sphaerisporangium sp. NPDC005288 TaxID=3155114 RepID=UPI0033BD07BC